MPITRNLESDGGTSEEKTSASEANVSEHSKEISTTLTSLVIYSGNYLKIVSSSCRASTRGNSKYP